MIDKELSELASYFEETALIEEGKKMCRLLAKKGVKIREHKWTELEAS